MIDDDYVLLSRNRIVCLNIFVLFVYDSDQFQGDKILEADSEVGQEKYAFFDDSDVGFENEIPFHCWVNVLQKLHFFIFVQGGRPIFSTVLVLNISFHFKAEFVTKLVVVFELGYRLLIVVVLFVLLVDVVHGDSNDIDHVSKEGGSAYLEDHYHNHLCFALRCEVSIAHCHNSCDCEVDGIYISGMEGLVGEPLVNCIDPA